MTTQSTSLRLADSVAHHPYEWPGGYPRYAITSDGAALCDRCCETERATIATTTGNDGWCVTAIGLNWEELDLYCDHCSKQIEAAYGE